MCFHPTRMHYICLPCRASFKKTIDSSRVHVCPRCQGELINAGAHLATPKRRDDAGWRALAAVLSAGLDFRGGCCGSGPGYRPRMPREVRERLAHAAASGATTAEALACADPTHTDVRRRAGRGASGQPPAETRCAPARGR